MRWLIWALFGNDDDGFYGDLAWNPSQKKSGLVAVLWWLRNPFHNLTFYVLNAKAPFVRRGRFPMDVFAPLGFAFNWCYIVNNSWFRFPFLSYRGVLGKFYIGWRERGNFGIKCTGKLLVLLVGLIACGVYKWMNC